MFLEILSKYFGILLIGIVIKLLDDEIDDDKTNTRSQSNLYRDVMEYKLPYCLLFLAIAMLLESQLIFALFTSAYMIGMFHLPHQRLPFKLKGYEEMIILFCINLLLIPFDIFAIAFISIFLIQLLDDLQDYQYDFKYGFKNFVNKYGKGEVILVSGILLVLCIIISLMNTMIILSSSFLINHLYSRI
ncbi:hypothetical protein SAMN05446037_1001194 [Anaerovirgula multivorans]|uniref:Uncharacterized protein n=1 Tax=Anaerovirgula multivorans TaxID=312168 RepID=A0A238ZXV9_9FIRM|nr:hypothetical protein [Anaerovirgula multivorans]SNR87972.1 hypothetical protein SAMN05446037_1001194 [Anaerovirgula multivorans]